VGFRSAYAFDVSQTDGKGLPELSERVTGNVGEYRERLVDFVIAQGITLKFKESIAPALGTCCGDRIVVLPGQSSAEEFGTLIRKLSHAFLHRAEHRTTTTKTVRETEAEAIAFAVGTTIGLHNGRASADYTGLYSETPRYSLKVWKSSRRHPPSSSPHSKPTPPSPPQKRSRNSPNSTHRAT
jgi:hypothetical protein